MAFHEAAVFPTQANGTVGGVGHNTLYLESQNGGLARIARWSGARRTFDVRGAIVTPEDASAMQTFILAREGGTHGFRFRDWNDYTTNPIGFVKDDGTGTPAWDDELIGTGDGVETQFQCVKRYAEGGSTRVRTIYKPIAGTVKSGTVTGGVGTEKTEGTDWTLDETTGIITYATPPGVGVQVKWGGLYDVAAHFGPGADALLSISIDSFYARSCPSVPVIEDVQPALFDDVYHYGGAFESSFSIPTQVTPLMGRVAMLTPTSATDLLLPSAAMFEYGGPYMVLTNLHGANALTVKSLGSTIGTLSASTSRFLVCAKISSAKTWKLA